MANENDENTTQEQGLNNGTQESAPQSEELAGTVKGQLKDIVGKGANNASATAGVSNTTNNTQSKSATTQTSEANYDPTKMLTPEQVKAIQGLSPSAVSQLMPYINDDIDPEKVAAKKKNADFRRGLHEVVESVRVLSDIGAAFAGGNVYKREAPDYKRYEDEKAKVDAARQKALDKLYAAQGEDRAFLRNILGQAFGKAYKGISQSNTAGAQQGNSQTNTNQATAGYGERGGNTYINTGNGGRDGKPWTSVKVINDEGNVVGSRRINFKSTADETSYYNALNKLVQQERTATQNSAVRQVATAVMHGNNAVSNLMNDKGIDTHTKYKHIRTLLNGGSVKYGGTEEKPEYIRLTVQERRNALSSIQLSDQQFRDLITDTLGYNERDYEYFDEQTNEGGGKNNKNANPVVNTKWNEEDFYRNL